MKKYRIIALWMERIASAGMMITLLSLFLFHCSFTYVLVSGAFFVILLIASFVISFLFWRCTNCAKGFPIRYGIVDKGETCPYCGKKNRIEYIGDHSIMNLDTKNAMQKPYELHSIFYFVGY